MPTEQQLLTVKSNLLSLKDISKTIFDSGNIKIIDVFSSLNKQDDVDRKLQCSVNLFTNSLVSINNISAKFLASNVAGYTLLTPDNLNNKQYSGVANCFSQVYNQIVVDIDNFYTLTEQLWFNTCQGTIYTPNGFYNLAVPLKDISEETFISSSVNFETAMQRLEESLRDSLK